MPRLNVVGQAVTALAMVLLCTAPLQAQNVADEIVLSNGSRILGTVTSVRGAVVNIDTDFAGSLAIPVDQITSLRTAEPVTLQLADESIIDNQPLVIEEGQLVVAAAGNLVAQGVDQLLLVNPEPWELGIGYKWTGLASFALVLERGNSDSDQLDYRLESVWRSVTDRYTLKAYGEKDEANEVKSADNWTILAKYDYFLDGPNYWGLNASAESDEFADLDLRYYVGPYVGRDFYTEPSFTFSAEVGLSYVNEDFKTAPDQDYMGANWSLHASSDYLGGNSLLYFDQLGIWNLDETSDMIVNTTFGLSFPLFWRLDAAAEILLEYDAGAVEGIEKLDQTYRFRVGYTW